MNRSNYAGYPMRDVLPRGYSFIQYVHIFRESGGYGGLAPPAAQGQAPTGTQVKKGARDLTMADKGKALGDTIAQGDKRENGEFDAIEGEARAEARWRNRPHT